MARQATGPIDLGIWGSVAVEPRLQQPRARGLARGGSRSARPDLHDDPAVLHEHGGGVRGGRHFCGRAGLDLALVGGSESMSRVQIGLDPGSLRLAAARSPGASRRPSGSQALRALRPRDIRLYVPEIKNRATGKSMGEHCEEMAKEWKIGRREQDEFALESHRRAVAAQERRLLRRPRPRGRPRARRVSRAATPRSRSSRSSQARLRPRARHDHRGQQLAADRRRRGGSGSRRTTGLAPPARGDAARPAGRLRDGGRRHLPRRPAHGAGRRDPAAARPPRPDVRGHRALGDPRGLRGPGALQPEGPRGRGIRPETAGVPHTFGPFPRASA